MHFIIIRKDKEIVCITLKGPQSECLSLDSSFYTKELLHNLTSTERKRSDVIVLSNNQNIIPLNTLNTVMYNKHAT